jgi:hypothetical protein
MVWFRLKICELINVVKILSIAVGVRLKKKEKTGEFFIMNSFINSYCSQMPIPWLHQGDVIEDARGDEKEIHFSRKTGR